ncbi:SpoIID/LytB domain-containing protein [Candidatus Sumerlaeota bacterium]|nr:SpoIID/LytB domain-containing protein [Candidatus Sumerlaeota bacterium]
MKILNLSFLCTILIFFGCSRIKSEPQSPPHVLQIANPMIRVLIMDPASEATFTPDAEFSVRTIDGKESAILSKDMMNTITILDGCVKIANAQGTSTGSALKFESLTPGGTFRIRSSMVDDKNKGRPYEGILEAYPTDDGKIEFVLALPMEEYLKGVVPYEIGADSPLEAMCAQAVAARSEAYVALVTRKYEGDHYDICSDVNCQVFRGNERRTPKSDEAVRLTCGNALLFEGQPISAYYASNCGGHSEDIRNVWSDRSQERAYWGGAVIDGEESAALDLTQEEDLRKWLNSSPSVYCNPEKYKIPQWAHKNFRWTREMNADEVTKAVAAKKDIGRVIAIKPVKRGVSGRLIEVEFVGETGSLVIGPELTIRRMFNPILRSAAFVVDTQGPADRPDRFIFKGAGSGHGVGMCQTGAIAMANAGKTFREILRHYYPKAEIKSLY